MTTPKNNSQQSAALPATGGRSAPEVPTSVRIAGIIACLEAVIGIIYAVILLVRQVRGDRDAAIVSEPGSNMDWVAFGTAVFFLIVFGAVLAAGLGLARGTHRWGRGLVIIFQVILLPIAMSMLGAGAWALGILTTVAAAGTLVCLFTKPAVAWAARSFGGRRAR